MNSRETFALDASVGVKWFRNEAGSDVARALRERVASGEIEIVVPDHFVVEVLSVVRRDFGPSEVLDAWETISDVVAAAVPLDADLVREAAAQCAALGCSFYDSLAPAVAARFDATLVSADARAHGGFPGVRIVG
jgi:predicted nucleic acid-binding protein